MEKKNSATNVWFDY